MYSGYVVKIKTRIHPNADRLQLATAMGNQVIVGIDVPDESIGIFFPADGCLSREMLINNNLLKIDGGYFEDNGRVRSMKLRGERSDGIWLPLESLLWSIYGKDPVNLNVGDQVTEINGRNICYKFVNEKTQKQAKQNQPKIAKKWVNTYFKQHIDTEQFRFNVHRIKQGSFITITEKLHGTSFRIGRVLDRVIKPLSRWERLLKFLKFPVRNEVSEIYAYMNGTRKTVIKDATGFYGNEEFRANLLNQVDGLLYKGETIYGELVGYTTVNKAIQAAGDNSKLNDKAITKLYGPKMHWRYGCNENQSKAYVYRITQTNEDGISFELSDYQARQRAVELGLDFVPLIIDPFLYDGDETLLRDIVEFRTEGPSTIDPSHIREGVVVRANDSWYKNKSFVFGVLEGYIKDQGEIDMEESA